MELTIKPINFCDENCFSFTAYDTLTKEKRQELIVCSQKESYGGKYFKFFLLQRGEETVGFMNVCGHSETIVSIAPEIKFQFRNKGYAFEGEKLILDIVKKLGFKIAIADVNEENLASVKLQEKLGFTNVRTYKNKKGQNMRFYIKAL